ncbi:hypothetical protein K0U83_09620 [bacterium]|nr:hypothetical protein [bacterium]
MLALAHAIGRPYGGGAGGPAFSPLDLGAKLKLWLPYNSTNRFQDTARTTPCTTAVPGTTDLVASWADISGNGFHMTQATAGNRPIFRSAGGCQFTGNKLMSSAAIGAWAADFDILIASRVTSYVASSRLIDMASINGVILGGANNTPGPNLFNAIIADGVPPYGLEVPCTDGLIHRVADRRVGTTHTLTIDGSAAGTESVSGAALPDSAVWLSADNSGGTSYCHNGDIFEVVVAVNLTSPERASLYGWFAAVSYL